MLSMYMNRSMTFVSEYFFAIVARIGNSRVNMLNFNMSGQSLEWGKGLETDLAHWTSEAMEVSLDHHVVPDIFVKFVEGLFGVY
jgi:hypothetical protein